MLHSGAAVAVIGAMLSSLGAFVGAIQCLRTLLVHVWTQCVYLLSIGSVVAVFVRRLLFLLCML